MPPATGSIGKTIAVPNTVSNEGNAAATAVRVSFFLSPVSQTAGQGRLIGTRDIASLPAGASSLATTTLTLPANLEPGSYFVSAVADVAGTVVEGMETNNGLTAENQILVGL
jgi:subtilase family serine protease